MATVCAGPTWADHVQDGQTFELRHLQPSFRDYVIAAVPATAKKPGRAEINIKLRTRYSHHCFTQAVEKVPAADPAHFYTCTVRNEERVFCVDRYKESLALPGIVGTIGKCYFTGKHNYFVYRDPQNPMLGEYFVYFVIERNERFVEMYIESAYPRLDGEREKRAKVTSLNALIVNAWRGKATHPPP